MDLSDHSEAAEQESRRALLQRIAREMTNAQKQHFGKGPVSTRAYLFDDLLQVVMREGLTVAEKTMVRFGRSDTVRSFRQEFHDSMDAQLSDLVEQATEREVIGCASQIMFDPDVVVTTFVFHPPLRGGFDRVALDDSEQNAGDTSRPRAATR